MVESRLTPHLKNNLIFYLGKQSNIFHHYTTNILPENGTFLSFAMIFENQRSTIRFEKEF